MLFRSWTYSYGNNQRLYHSALYWFSGILVVVVSLIPKVIWRHVRSIYFPTDIEIMRQIEKFDPQHDFVRDPAMPNIRAAKEYGLNVPEGQTGTGKQAGTIDEQQQHIYPMAPLGHVMSRASSIQHDMLTGSHTPVRGYSFSADDPKPKRKSTIREKLLPSGLRNTLSRRRDKRLSTIRNSDAGHDDIRETEGERVQEFGQVQEEPGPEAESEDEDETEEEAANTRQPTLQERVEDTLLPNTRGQMNGPMSTNQ